MKQAIQEIFERKSVRVFSDEKITDTEKKLILEAALQAPTAGNMALYSIVDIKDQELKDKLADLCDHQPFISKAPFVLIFLADYQKWFDIFNEYTQGVTQLEESDLFLATEDCMIAAQNAVVAAQSLGIGSCYIGDILENYETVKELLDLPQYALPYTMLVFGKPTQQQKDRQKPKRFALEDMVHQNKYQHKTIEQTKTMFVKQTDKSLEDLEKYVQAFAKRKFFTEFRYEMNRSCREMLKSWLK